MQFGKYCILLIFHQSAWKNTVSVAKLSKMHCVVPIGELANCPHCPGLQGLRTKGALDGTPADQVAGATFGCQLAPPVNFFSPAFHWRSPLKSSMQNTQKTHYVIRKEWCMIPEILLFEIRSSLFAFSDNKEHRLKLIEDA